MRRLVLAAPLMTPYDALLSALPPAIAAQCERFDYTETFPADPGELAEADCTLSSDSPAGYVTYSIFADAASMDASYNLLKRGYGRLGSIEGPGCGAGPGESTWERGRKLCYSNSLIDDAAVLWTHETLYIAATATQDDGDRAKLEQFWTTAGPIGP